METYISTLRTDPWTFVVGARAAPPRRYVLKADPTRQLALLDLQAIDTRLDQIAHATSNLPAASPSSTRARARPRTLDTQLVNSRTALADVQREVAKAEADVQLVRDRAARDRARLDAGTGTAKDLQALQHELTSLSRRQAELEDIELEIMERAEACREHVDRARARPARARHPARGGRRGEGPRDG